MSWLRLAGCFLLGLAIAVPAAAASGDEPGEPEVPPPFHAAFLFGESHNGERNGVTIGGDFEYRFQRRLGIGVTGEHVNEPFRENVWIVPLLIHPLTEGAARGLKLTIGPGFERARESHEESAIEQRAVWRAGAGYDFALRHGWTIDPDFAVDFVAGEKVLVYSVAIGKEFGHR